MLLKNKLRSPIFHVLFVIIVMLNSKSIFAYSERTHQYIVQESYKLLKKFLNERDVPEIKNHIGIKETGGFLSWTVRGDSFTEDKIVTGAFREDIDDIMYGYGEQWGFPLTEQGMQEWVASVTHFWDADQGDDYPTNLDLVPYSDMPNAYKKIMRYFEGRIWGIVGDIKVNKINADGSRGEEFTLYFEDGKKGGYLEYLNLIHLYKTNRMGVRFPTIVDNRSWEGPVYVSDELKNTINTW